ncbi:MAG TPA: hypothetical protein VIJ19_02670 [Opitutaceae bacterium]
MTRPTTKLAILAAAWAGAALAAGSLGLLRQLPPAMVGIGIAAAVGAFSYGSLGRGWLAEAMQSLGLRGILALNIFRLEGLYFLRLGSEGRLPTIFADRAGWGDVAAAAGAIVLLLWRGGRGFRTALWVWNVLGVLDLAVAVGTATWLNLTSPGAMAAFTVPPFCLVPFWAVPLLLCGHVYLFASGLGEARAVPPSPQGA